MSINQLFGKLDTLEFVELGVLFFPSIKRQADFPRPREYGFVVNRRLIIEVIGVGKRVPFDDMHVLTHEIAGAIEPALPVESRDIDHECVPFPVPV